MPRSPWRVGPDARPALGSLGGSVKRFPCPAVGIPSALRLMRSEAMREPVTPPTQTAASAPGDVTGRSAVNAQGGVSAEPAARGAGSGGSAGSSGPTRAVREATPLALAGFVANAANVLVTLAVARILSTDDYGTQAQLVAIFFVVSMPGSALLVGIVRRVPRWRSTGHSELIPAWSRRIRRYGLTTIAAVGV